MWKLWHKLFGWEYVEFTYAGKRRVGRIKYSPGGILIVNTYLGNYQDVKEFGKNITAVTMTKEELDSWMQKEE
jgi:hypothetical protein